MTPTPTTGPSGLVERLIPVCRRARETAIRPREGQPGKYGMDIDRAIVADLVADILALPEFAALTSQPGEAAALAGELERQLRAIVWEAMKKHHAAPALLRRDMADETLKEAVASILAALVPADPAKGET
jgi:hypothetical protein